MSDSNINIIEMKNLLKEYTFSDKKSFEIMGDKLQKFLKDSFYIDDRTADSCVTIRKADDIWWGFAENSFLATNCLKALLRNPKFSGVDPYKISSNYEIKIGSLL